MTYNSVPEQIKSRELHASIAYDPAPTSAADATVTFLPDPEPHNTAETIKALNNRINITANLGQWTAVQDSQLATSKVFLKKVCCIMLLLE